MRRTDGPGRAMLLAIGLSVVAGPAVAEPIDRVAWLAGCWRGDDGERRVDEQWMAPRAGLMLGMSRTATSTKVASHEQMRIETDGDGMVFTSKPSGKPEDSFRALPGDPETVVFENLAHPFPQRIVYRRSGDSAVIARIEGLRGDRLVGVDFPMRRAACDTP